MPGLDLMLFGPPHVQRGGVPLEIDRRKTIALLAYLAVTGRSHGRDALAALFWPEADQVQARTDLRRALSELRQICGPDILQAEGDCVAVRAAALEADVVRFQAILARVTAHHHGDGPLCPDCLAGLDEAATLYRDDFLAGFSLRDTEEFDTWQTFTTETLRLELSAALEQLAGGLAEHGQSAAALAHARRWLSLDALNEAAHRLLMQLYAASGDRAAAAHQYEQCARILAAELGVEPESATTRLYQALVQSPDREPTPAGATGEARTAAVVAHNLPPDVTPFIGREEQLAVVAGRLADPTCHLLTVLGPGGIGKTRLAIHAARDEVGRFPHGVWFVDLAPTASAEVLAGTILATLGVAERGTAGTDERLLDYLRDRRLLLVLDNYEHLLTGPEPDRRDGYGLVMQVVSQAPQVKLLVTSRTRLNVAAEWLAPLEGLQVPREAPAGGGPRAPARDAVRAALEQYSATHLFLSCMRRLRPDYQPDAADGQTIGHICRLLDGVPLAIEFAAAWTRTLPLAEIARRLEQGLELLTTTMRGVPPRQRSMAATFDHSWRLLTPRERSILRQASVFRGGFTAEAAEAVTGASLGDLANLVDASWLRLGEAGRYAVHELIRQYCADKLAQEHEAVAGELPDAVRARHARFFQHISVRDWIEMWRRPGLIREIGRDRANYLLAWQWSLDAGDLKGLLDVRAAVDSLSERLGFRSDVLRTYETSLHRLRGDIAAQHGNPYYIAAVVAIMVAICEIWQRMSRVKQGLALLDEADRLVDQEVDADRRVELMYFTQRSRAWFLLDAGDFAGSTRLFTALRAALRAKRVILFPYTPEVTRQWDIELGWALGFNAVALGEYGEAVRLADEAIAEARALNLELYEGYCLRAKTMALLQLGDYVEAERAARRLNHLAQAYGDNLVAHMGLRLLGQTRLALGRGEEARSLFRREYELLRDTGMQDTSGATLFLLGHADMALGDLAAAERHYRQACDVGWPSGGLYGLAWLALTRGDPAAARDLCRQVLARQSLGASLKGQALIRFAEAIAQLGEGERAAELCGFLLAWHGTPYAVRKSAEKLAEELAAQLPAEVQAAAVSRGAARELAAAIAEIVGEGS